MSNMHDLTGWTPTTCAESERIRQDLHPASSLTDLNGTYGTPVVYTEWADDSERPALRDYHWPGTNRPCEHYVPSSTPAGEEADRA